MRLPILLAVLAVTGCSTTSRLSGKSGEQAWSALLQSADSCARKEGTACADLFGDHSPELDGARGARPDQLLRPEDVTGCRAGAEMTCCRLAASINAGAEKLSTQNVALAYELVHCIPAPTHSLFRSFSEAPPRQDVLLTPGALRERADLLTRAEQRRSQACQPYAGNPVALRDQGCASPPLLLGLAKTISDAADRLERSGSICGPQLECALACASGIGPACKRWRGIDSGGGELAGAVGAGIYEALARCAGGVDTFCAFAAPAIDPSSPLAVKLDEHACEQEDRLGCDALEDLLVHAQHTLGLSVDDAAAIRGWLQSSCEDGRSGLACLTWAMVTHAPDATPKALPIWAAKFKAHPEQWSAQRALVEWAKRVPASGRSGVDLEASYRTLWNLEVACSTGLAEENGDVEEDGACAAVRDLVVQPGSVLGSFKPRLIHDCLDQHLGCEDEFRDAR